MERILPIELENARLRKSFRGYAPDDVDELLRVAARSLESLIVENGALRDQNERQRVELEGLRGEESQIRDALVAAQRTADGVRADAQRHADLILEEARQAALAERVAVQQRVSEMRWEIERLKTERQRFIDEFRALLERQQRDLLAVPDLEVLQTSVA